MIVLVTGGAGYIGSHFVKYLVQNDHRVIVIDNLSRGHIEAVDKNALFENVDLLDYQYVLKILLKHKPEAVVHFAAFAYVGESVEKPDLYYHNNVIGSFNLIKACSDLNINKFVFSSTCSIYGNPEDIPISEDHISNPINPYANTKLIIEMMLKDFDTSYGMKSVALRYFNAAGADFSGEIGESHFPETHLLPLVIDAALGKREKIMVYGNDYDTPDGTCVRDYIHVNDLAEAHLQALNFLLKNNESTMINLGTGSGYTVLEIIKRTEKISGEKIIYEITGRRAGDPDVLVADNKKAKKLLNWNPKYSIDQIIESAINWSKNRRY